jgi:integrase
VVLSADTPYLTVQKNPFRPLKTAGSKRFIPLVGVALEATTEAVAGKGAEEWLFDSYIDVNKQNTKNTAASAAINKRLKAVLGDNAATCHSFRHTFNTRLRNVECPKDLRDELGGWASSVSGSYGSPTNIRIKHQYLLSSIDAPSGVDWA